MTNYVDFPMRRLRAVIAVIIGGFPLMAVSSSKLTAFAILDYGKISLPILYLTQMHLHLNQEYYFIILCDIIPIAFRLWFWQEFII
jgi:hypothetical protein